MTQPWDDEHGMAATGAIRLFEADPDLLEAVPEAERALALRARGGADGPGVPGLVGHERRRRARPGAC